MFTTKLINLLISTTLSTTALAKKHAGDKSAPTTTGPCASALEPIITSLPTPPPEFLSFWSDNNPLTKSCLAEPPASLSSQFDSVYGEYSSWWVGNSDAVADITSFCGGGDLEALFGGEGTGTVAGIPGVTDVPSDWEDWAGILTALPGGGSGGEGDVGFGGFDFTACATTGDSAAATGGADGPGKPGSDEPSQASGGGVKEAELGVMFMAGVIGAIMV